MGTGFRKDVSMMKKIVAVALGLALALTLAACGQPGASISQPAASNPPKTAGPASTPPEETPDVSTTQPKPVDPPDSEAGKTLVVYFSATGSTKKVAGYIADALNAEQFELIPAQPYNSTDLRWSNADSRVSREHDDESLRDVALVSNTVDNWADYDTVFIGYPIWWGIAAWPVNDFVKNNDFTGKAVIPFCTSSSSGLGESGELLAEMAGTGHWQIGTRFVSSVSEADVVKWVNGLNI